MKSYTSLIVVALLIASLSSCSKKPAHEVLKSSTVMVIEPGVSIGPIHSGMTMKQVVTELGEPNKNQDGILMYSNVSVFLTEDGFVAHVFCFDSSTNGVSTNASLGHTKEGIGIGSSRADVISAYGEPTATKHENVHKENEVLVYETIHLQFHIRDGKVYLIAVYFKK
jgi:hypothetical protein